MRTFDDTELMQAIIANSENISQVLASLGLPRTGEMYKSLRSWASENHVALPKGNPNRAPSSKRYTLEEVMVENSSYSTTSLKLRLVSELGWKYECSNEDCPNPKPEWRGQVLSLHLDHINGVNTDNRPNNLRFLCPNCHTQTPTYGSKNRSYKSLILLCSCGRRKSRGANNCILCENGSRKGSNTKIVWPALENLLHSLRGTSFRKVAMDLGVSDNAIRKHLHSRGIDYKTLCPYKED